MRVYSVIFKENGKNYYFNGEDDYKIGDNVILQTERGYQYGRINYVVKDNYVNNEFKNIVRLATKEDTDKYLSHLKEAKLALSKCRELVKTLGLQMNVISADFTFEKEQLIFNFTADGRVDFRELAKKLAAIYHTRIELRQYGARDKAKDVGGVGVCGQKLCCSRFLEHIDTISMNMAKDQNLALNPSKINGCCGRLLCCLQYEDENYVESSVGLPHIGDDYKDDKVNGKVVGVDILNRKIKVLSNGVKEEVYIPYGK